MIDVGIALLGPDIKFTAGRLWDHEFYDEILDEVNRCFDSETNEYDNEVYQKMASSYSTHTYYKWAFGFILWNKIIDIHPKLKDKVCIIRTNAFQDNDYEEFYFLNLKICSFKYCKPHGHLIWKTVKIFEMFADKFDYIVRGNCNIALNYDKMLQAIENAKIPRYKVYTSPFFDGDSYAFGYFNLVSSDVAKHMVEMGKIHQKWWSEPYADDAAIQEAALNLGCTPFSWDHKWKSGGLPIQSETIKNKLGVILPATKSYEEIICDLNTISSTVFLFRCRSLNDCNYIKLYKYLLKLT